MIEPADPPLISHKTITLGVPAFNEEKYIQGTLESIQAQTHGDFAVLISDNASSDGTRAICDRFARGDSRFKVISQPKNIGSARNFDFLRQSTSSPYFAWIGGHDLLRPDYLKNHLQALESHSEIGCSFTYWEFIDQAGEVLRMGRDTGIGAPRRGSFRRYIWSVSMAVELGPMHGVFRRKYLCGIPMHNCPACDHIMLSNSLYLAPFRSIPGHLYRLRDFHESTSRREENVIQRITGDASATADLRSTIACYLEDFDRIVPVDSWHRRCRPLVKWALHDRFTRGGFRMTTLACSVLKRAHAIRKLIPGTRSRLTF